MKIRKAKFEDVKAIHQLINYYAQKEKLLPRSLNDIYENLRDFWVAEDEKEIVGCVCLHISWEKLGEIKSLCVKKKEWGRGVGGKLVKKALEEAQELGIKKVFLLTYIPDYFKKFGFSLIPKEKLPHKIWTECINCPKFPDCQEEAMIKEIKKCQ